MRIALPWCWPLTFSELADHREVVLGSVDFAKFELHIDDFFFFEISLFVFVFSETLIHPVTQNVVSVSMDLCKRVLNYGGLS